MKIFGRNENNNYIIDYDNKVSLDVFTDSAGYRRPDGIFDSNVGFFIYQGPNLVHCKRKDFKKKTNNFGELKAIEMGLKYVTKHLSNSCYEINIYSDSLLSIKCLTTYLEKWLETAVDGIMYNSKNVPVKNQDIIWRIIKMRDYLESKGIDINIYFVRSHSPKSKIKQYHELYCKDNGVLISIKDYEIIRARNEYCDLFIKR